MCKAVNPGGAATDLPGRDTAVSTLVPEAVNSEMHFTRLLKRTQVRFNSSQPLQLPIWQVSLVLFFQSFFVPYSFLPKYTAFTPKICFYFWLSGNRINQHSYAFVNIACQVFSENTLCAFVTMKVIKSAIVNKLKNVWT